MSEHHRARAGTLLAALILASLPLTTLGQDRAAAPPPAASASAEQMTAAAVAFLESLTAAQREAATQAFTGQNRTNWSNVPMFVHARPGVRIGDLTDEQRRAAHDLLRASASSQGYQKIAGVMRLDRVHGALSLEALEQHGPEEGARPYYQEEAESFGTGSYAVAIFGNPSSGADWGWLLQGHHLGASFTVSEGRTGFTPLFLGATPLVIQSGIDAGWSALSHEVTRGFELVSSLTPDQRADAIAPGEIPSDVPAGVGHKDTVVDFAGLRAADMTPPQRRLLRVLVEEYVRNADFDAAEAQLQAIGAGGWENLWFSWRGPADDPAAPFFYRIHGERILIELTQRTNHIHTIVRDPVNDYGEDWFDQSFIEEMSASDRFDAAVRAYESAGGGL